MSTSDAPAGRPEGHEYDIGPSCPTCGADLHWEDCDSCGGEGADGHSCGDDTCCCRYPVDNVRCGQCEGYGGWHQCYERHEGQRCFLPSELPKDAAAQ